MGKTIAEVGVGVVAVAAATAGAMFLYGKQGTKYRKKIKGWAMKMKGEVVEQLETLQEWNEEMYHKVIDEVAERYRAVKNIDPSELEAMVKELKAHWRNIKSQLSPKKKSAKKPAKKSKK